MGAEGTNGQHRYVVLTTLSRRRRLFKIEPAQTGRRCHTPAPALRQPKRPTQLVAGLERDDYGYPGV